MDFELSEQHKMLRDNVYNFAVKEFGPIAEKMDREDIWPEDAFKKFAAIGIVGMTVPIKYEGAGADLLSQVIAEEQLARVCPAIALTYGASEESLLLLWKRGSPVFP